VRQIAVEAPTVSTVLGRPTAVRSSTGARKTVRRQARLPRTPTQMFHERSLAGPQAQQAAHEATRSEVPTARPPLVVACPGTPGTNNSQGRKE
jgi:hypothetical protein